jgi:hypothetical protein
MSLPTRRAAAVLLATLAACGGTGPTGNGRTPAAPAFSLQGTPLAWSAYKVTVPPGMKVTKDGSGGFVQLDGTGCTLFLLPPVTAQADQDQQAYDTLKALFTDYNPKRWGPLVGINDPNPLEDSFHQRGISSEGWPYVDLRTGFRAPGGSGFTRDMARVLVANRGDGTSAIVVGYQTDSNVRCINEGFGGNPFEWLLMLYSLSLPGAKPVNANALHDALLGEWFMGSVGPTMTTGLYFVFANNGRMDTATTVQTYQDLNSSQYLERTSTWSGSGDWVLDKGLLEELPDDAQLAAQSQFVRYYKERNSTEPSGWREYLWMLSACGSTPCEAAAWRP